MSDKILRKYGVATTVDFSLYAVDGTVLKNDAVFAAGDVKIMKDEGESANITTLPSIPVNGLGYKQPLTVEEMTTSRIVITIVDQTSPQVWLDKTIEIETYGNPAAQHPFDFGNAAESIKAELDSRARLDYKEPVSTDLVKVAPVDIASDSGGDWGAFVLPTTTFLYTLDDGHQTRIRQAGVIEKVKFYCTRLDYLTVFKLMIWRRRGESSGNWDLIGESENLLSKMSVGLNEITLDNPIIGVEEGDFAGTGIVWSQHPTQGNFKYLTGGCYLWFNPDKSSPPGSIDINWIAGTYHNNGYQPVELYIKAPVCICLGDSIISGYALHSGYADSVTLNNRPASIPWNIGNILDITYQNLGIVGQTTAQILARIAADCTIYKPAFAVLDGGHNDLTVSVPVNTILANFESIIQAVKAANIKPVIMLMTPRTSGSNALMQDADSVNAGLRALAAKYNAIVADTMLATGQFRSGGDAGNLWDIQTQYNGDGLHFSQAGYVRLAEAISNVILNRSITTSQNFVTNLINTIPAALAKEADATANKEAVIAAIPSVAGLASQASADAIRNILEGDTEIDKTATPWQIVVKNKTTGAELIRKNLKDVNGANVTGTTTVIGQIKEPAV